MKIIDWTTLENTYTYATYRQHIDDLLTQGKTTGHLHNEAMLEYTRMNVVRMQRLDKSKRLTDTSLAVMSNVDRPLVWLTITEAWCGDAAQILPILQQLADLNPLVKHHLVLRDEQPGLMNAFLTSGARSIPMTIVIDEPTGEVLGHWGPRPTEAHELVVAAKAAAASSTDDAHHILSKAKVDLQKWYARDKTEQIQREFLTQLPVVV